MKKVLVVEDDRKIAQALVVRLEHTGYEVAIATDAATAISTAPQFRPDVVLLDVSIPRGDGFIVAECLRSMPQTASTPLIFLTASKHPEFRERAAMLGVAAYFEKPYDSDKLIEAISAAVSG